MIEGPERESCIWRQSTLEYWTASFSGYTQYVYFFTACFLGVIRRHMSRALLGELIVRRLVKEISTFYEIRKFITMFKSAYQMSLFCTRSVQSTPSQLISLRFIQMLSSHLSPCHPIVLFLSFPHQNRIRVLPLTFHTHHSSHDSWLITRISDEKQNHQFLNVQSPPIPCYLILLTQKYIPHHPVRENPQPLYCPKCERPIFMPVYNHRQS